MTWRADNLRHVLRRWLRPLSATPLHPQWLMHKAGRARIEWVAQRAGGEVLDIGCADRSIRHALPRMQQYTGLDYPATVKHLYGTHPDVFGDASELPFMDACFDTVMMLDVLEHVTKPGASLREAGRVLRPGGCMLITIPFAYPLHDQPHDYQRFTAHGLEYRLKEAGLSLVTLHEVMDGIEASAGCLALSLSQGAIDALVVRDWRILFLPVVLLLIPFVNIAGWLLPFFVPAKRFMPAAYYIHALRPLGE